MKGTCWQYIRSQWEKNDADADWLWLMEIKMMTLQREFKDILKRKVKNWWCGLFCWNIPGPTELLDSMRCNLLVLDRQQRDVPEVSVARPVVACRGLRGYAPPDHHWPTTKPVVLTDVTRLMFSTDPFASVTCGQGERLHLWKTHLAKSKTSDYLFMSEKMRRGNVSGLHLLHHQCFGVVSSVHLLLPPSADQISIAEV